MIQIKRKLITISILDMNTSVLISILDMNTSVLISILDMNTSVLISKGKSARQGFLI